MASGVSFKVGWSRAQLQSTGYNFIKNAYLLYTYVWVNILNHYYNHIITKISRVIVGIRTWSLYNSRSQSPQWLRTASKEANSANLLWNLVLFFLTDRPFRETAWTFESRESQFLSLFHFVSLSLSLSLCLSLIALDSLTFLQPSTNDFMVVKMTSYTSKGSNNDNQCGQIGWFITLWVNFQSPWQQLFCLKCQHILGIFCKFVKFFHFTIKILFGQLFTGHTDDNNFYLLYLAELFDVFVWLLLFYLLLRLIGIGLVLASKFSSATGNSNFVIYITRTSREEIWNILYWRPSQ